MDPFLIIAALAAAAFALCLAAAADESPTLYNGIRPPAPWPPRLDELTREPMRVPYLEQPPEVIPIDVGRQLFVDDFLIEHTTLTRAYRRTAYHPDNPVLRPDKPWERHGEPCAMAFSDGAWFDPQDGLFKLWYQASYEPEQRSVCLAVSQDGIHWEKPAWDVRAGTNIVLPPAKGVFRDSVTVWLDHEETDARKRFKLWRSTIKRTIVNGQRHSRRWLMLYLSPDGVHWTPAGESPKVGDRSTVFYNPFRGVWVWSIRSYYEPVGRSRDYREHPDAVAGMQWTPQEQFKWCCADRLDPRNPNPEYRHIEPQLYNLDAAAYESVLLGLFSIWQGDPRQMGHPRLRKRNEVLLGFSRDGWHWHRPDRRPFAGVNETEGAWNWGNVQSVAGGCLVVGDELYFYVSGRAAIENRELSTGLAVLRRDGFASMDADDSPGALTTRPVRFRGKRLFVNIDAPDGELRVEVLRPNGDAVEPFTRERCRPVCGDSTLAEVSWEGVDDLSAVSGEAVKFRFHLRRGRLYAFWVSPDASGASYGYVAAGGPGFTGAVDTVGRAAYAG